MTENQTKEVLKLLTRCVSGIQRLESDMTGVKTEASGLKSDVSELKTGVTSLNEGLSRLEDRQDTFEESHHTIISELRINNGIFSEVVNEQARLGARVTLLKERAH